MTPTMKIKLWTCAILTVFFAFLFSTACAAGELETKSRVGDIVHVPIMCLDLEAAEYMAVGVESGLPREHVDLEKVHRCITAPINNGNRVYPLGKLVAWESGPYQWEVSGGVSVWRFALPNGEEGFTILPNSVGPHRNKPL